MTLNEFINKWSGKPVDFDGIYPDQCMDLAHFYVKEVLNLSDTSIIAAPLAKQVFLNFKWENYFEKITNTPTNYPQRGDLVIWDGDCGHIAIALDATVKDFHSFDANYPLGSLPHVQYHTYDSVLGWLHPLNQEQPITQNDYLKLKEKYDQYKKKAEELADKFKYCQSELKVAGTARDDSRADVAILQDKIKKMEAHYLINKTPLYKYTTGELVKELFRRFKGGVTE